MSHIMINWTNTCFKGSNKHCVTINLGRLICVLKLPTNFFLYIRAQSQIFRPGQYSNISIETPGGNIRFSGVCPRLVILHTFIGLDIQIAKPDSKDIRRFRVGSIFTRCRSNGLCYPGIDFKMYIEINNKYSWWNALPPLRTGKQSTSKAIRNDMNFRIKHTFISISTLPLL